MQERPAALASGLAALFALLLGACLAATGNWRAALILGAADASLNLTGPGLFESLSEAMVPGMRSAPAGAAGAALTPPLPDPGFAGTAAGGTSPGRLSPAGEAPSGSGSGTGDSYGSPAADPAAEEDEEEKRLKRIEMPKRGRGETRLYGGTPSRAPASAARSSPPDASSIEASFGGMIDRLKSRASSGAGGASLGGGKRPAGEGAAAGDGSPVLTRNGKLDPKYDSPTLRALQKANKEAAHSASMSSDPALEDGTKDHAGRGFDGNKNVRGQVPIEERSGAMGRSSIGVAPEQ